MKFKTLYVGTISGWVIIVIIEIVEALFGAHQLKKSNVLIQILYTILKYGRRTTLFVIAISNLLLLAQKQQRNY